MFKKIMLMLLVLSVGTSVYGAASDGWIRVKSRAEKRREQEIRRDQRRAQEAQAAAAEKARYKQQQQEERKKREHLEQIRRKNEITRLLFVAVNNYISATWFSEDRVDKSLYFDEMSQLIERGANINAMNSASKETVVHQAIRCSRLCLVEFLLKNRAIITEEDAALLRICVKKDARLSYRSPEYDTAFLLSFSKDLDSDESSAASSSSVGSQARDRYYAHGTSWRLGPDWDYYPSDPID
ncbi:hypothetical protein K2W90_04695 [Candidatus Babeliales bacterium]|nr:hypothetical protein [Candidatus Babeliales bacterium]